MLVSKILHLPNLLSSARFLGMIMPLCTKINSVKFMLLKHEASTTNERGVGCNFAYCYKEACGLMLTHIDGFMY